MSPNEGVRRVMDALTTNLSYELGSHSHCVYYYFNSKPAVVSRAAQLQLAVFAIIIATWARCMGLG